MSTGTICLLISAGIMIIVTIYLDIIGEQVAEIKEIAEELRFPNQSFMGKFFKEHVGVSPLTYRKG